MVEAMLWRGHIWLLMEQAHQWLLMMWLLKEVSGWILRCIRPSVHVQSHAAKLTRRWVPVRMNNEPKHTANIQLKTFPRQGKGILWNGQASHPISTNKISTNKQLLTVAAVRAWKKHLQGLQTSGSHLPQCIFIQTLKPTVLFIVRLVCQNTVEPLKMLVLWKKRLSIQILSVICLSNLLNLRLMSALPPHLDCFDLNTEEEEVFTLAVGRLYEPKSHNEEDNDKENYCLPSQSYEICYSGAKTHS